MQYNTFTDCSGLSHGHPAVLCVVTCLQYINVTLDLSTVSPLLTNTAVKKCYIALAQIFDKLTPLELAGDCSLKVHFKPRDFCGTELVTSFTRKCPRVWQEINSSYRGAGAGVRLPHPSVRLPFAPYFSAMTLTVSYPADDPAPPGSLHADHILAHLDDGGAKGMGNLSSGISVRVGRNPTGSLRMLHEKPPTPAKRAAAASTGEPPSSRLRSGRNH